MVDAGNGTGTRRSGFAPNWPKKNDDHETKQTTNAACCCTRPFSPVSAPFSHSDASLSTPGVPTGKQGGGVERERTNGLPFLYTGSD